jgi:hypothetical protein
MKLGGCGHLHQTAGFNKENGVPVTRQQLDECNFFHTHDIVIDGDGPTFQRQGAVTPAHASIYMWLSPSPNDATLFDTMYVGKAGYGVERRQSQHKGGFTHSGTGRANRTLIADWLARGRTLHVYARISGSTTIFGKSTSLYSTEEAAACEAFEPCWNRANFPQIRGAATVNLPPIALIPPATEEAVTVPEDQQPLVGEDPAATTAVAFQDIPQGDEVGMFVQSLDVDTQVRFLRAMDFLQQSQPTATHKIVRGYSDQPAGYNNKPMLVIGNVRESDGRAVRWFARVPLINEDCTPLTIIFHRDLLNPTVETARVSIGRKGDWRPIDLDAFLGNPDDYLVH